MSDERNGIEFERRLLTLLSDSVEQFRSGGLPFSSLALDIGALLDSRTLASDEWLGAFALARSDLEIAYLQALHRPTLLSDAYDPLVQDGLYYLVLLIDRAIADLI